MVREASIAYVSLLGRYVLTDLGRVVLLALLLLSGIALNVTSPQFIRHFIDLAKQQGDLGQLYTAAALFLGVGLTIHVVTALTEYLGEDVAWRATNRLRSDVVLHVLSLDMGFHNARTPGELIERIDGDIERLSNFFSKMVVSMLGGVLLSVGILVVLWVEDWRLGLSMSLFAAAYLGVYVRLQRIVAPLWHGERDTSADLSGFIGERLSAIPDIQKSGAVPYVTRRYFEVKRRHFEAWLRALKFAYIRMGAADSMFAVGLSATMALGAYSFQTGEFSIGTAYLMVHYFNLLRDPLMRLSWEVEDLHRAAVSIDRVRELLDTRPAIQDGRGGEVPPGGLSVDFERVSFRYSADLPVLRDISFTLEPGEVLGLLGRTGSGKTTMSRLLFRLYDPLEGSIRLGGVDVRKVRIGDVRARVGLVSQEVQVFEASLRDNVTLFNPAIEDDRIIETLRSLGLKGWLRSLPDGLDTRLSSTGRMSAGEEQLLAFARVFLSDPDVVILDEASSRLDPATEELIDQAVTGLLRGRTAIVIAHRLTTVQRVDRILVLEGGRIVEHGPREVLAADPESRFAALLRSGLEEAPA